MNDLYEKHYRKFAYDNILRFLNILELEAIRSNNLTNSTDTLKSLIPLRVRTEGVQKIDELYSAPESSAYRGLYCVSEFIIILAHNYCNNTIPSFLDLAYNNKIIVSDAQRFLNSEELAEYFENFGSVELLFLPQMLGNIIDLNKHLGDDDPLDIYYTLYDIKKYLMKQEGTTLDLPGLQKYEQCVSKLINLIHFTSPNILGSGVEVARLLDEIRTDFYGLYRSVMGIDNSNPFGRMTAFLEYKSYGEQPLINNESIFHKEDLDKPEHLRQVKIF